MADLKIDCSIDFDDEWLQEGCHWSYKRFFNLTFVVLDASLTNLKFYYKLGKANNVLITPSKKNNTYTYVLNLTDVLDTILSNPDTYLDTDRNYLTISTEVTGGTEILGSASYDYYLKLPPQQVQSLTIDVVVDNPGELKCSWEHPEETYDTSEAAGYCIELFHCPENETEFTKLGGLRWNEADRRNGIYRVESIPTYGDLTPTAPPVIDKNTEITFAALKSSTELYLWEPASKPADYKPEFYFTPRYLQGKLGNHIKPGDKYLLRVYPYNVYSTYFDESNLPNPSALLANEYIEKEGKVSKGIVRVKTDRGWAEGQVWVCVSDATTEDPDRITWKQAEAIYTRTADDWKEAQ